MNTHVTLSTGQLIPSIGLGTWESPNNEAADAVKYAVLEAGYRHIDCAAAYGNESQIGKAFKDIFAQVPREEIFITSKLWNTNHNPEHIEAACRKTLSDLHLDQLDLYLMHWGLAFEHGDTVFPVGKDGIVRLEKVSIHDTWKGLENLIKKGLVKAIGVANFTTMMLIDLLTYAEVMPVMNQIELHPYNTQQELVNFCLSNSIAVTGYSPLGRMGVDTGGPKLIEEATITDMAAKYKKTPSQIILHWAVKRGTVVIPKSTNQKRIQENIAIYDFDMTDDEKLEIDGLNKNYRFVNPNKAWGIPVFS